MTDKYGDQDNMHHEDGSQDLGTQAEAWQEDQPPIDDFADGDVDSVVSDVEEDTPEADETPRKGSMMVPIVAAIVCVAFVGTLFYIQFGSEIVGKSSVQATDVLKGELETKTENEKTPLAPAASEKTTTTDSGYSDLYPPVGQSSSSPGNAAQADVSSISTEPMTSVAENAAAVPSAPVAAASAPEKNKEAAPVSTDKNKEASTAIAPPPAPATLPTVEQPSTTALTQAEKLVASTPVAAPAPAAVSSPSAKPQALVDAAAQAAQEAKITELVNRIDTLQKMLEQTTQQMSQMSGTVANIQAASAQAVVDTEKETSKAKLKKEKKTVAATTASSSEETMVDEAEKVAALPEKDGLISPEALAPTSSEEKVSSAKEVEEKAKTEKKSSKKKKQVSTQSKKAKSSANKTWVLRAATPDTAWVSTSDDSSELRQVEIGKELPGIGKVREIRQSGDSWEIVGTKGVVR